MANDLQLFTVSIGGLTNAVKPIIRLPAGYGGITILEAYALQGGSTNASLYLVTLGSAGTAVDSGGTMNTTACGGTADPFVANTPKAMTLATTYVAASTYLGVKESNVAACAGTALFSFSYVTGV